MSSILAHITGKVFLPAVTLLVLALAGLAQTTYEDPQGRFVLDLPEGWELAPPMELFKNDLITEFNVKDKVKDKTFTLAFNPRISNPDKLIKHVETQFQFLKPSFEGKIMKMEVNGHPARWGALQTPLDPELIVLCGSVALKRDGLYFFFTVQRAVLPEHEDDVKRVFQSIRLPGEAVAAAANIEAMDAPAARSIRPTSWKVDSISLTLPPGWVEQPKPRGFEKEVKGWFMNENLDGVTSFVVVYRGLGMNLAKAFDAGIKSVTIPMPGLKPIEHEELTFEKGKAQWAVFQGPHAAGGAEVEVASVLVSLKASKGFANLVVMGPAIHLSELKTQALEIAKTVR